MVITGLTRNRLFYSTIILSNLLIHLALASFAIAFLARLYLAVFLHYGNQASAVTNKFNMESYRSGHNGADSKSVCEQSHEGSTPSLSAKLLEGFRPQGVFSFYPNAVPIANALAFLLSLSIWL